MFLVESLGFEPVNVMFGRRFPFLPSNWCRGNLGLFKRGKVKGGKLGGGAGVGGGGGKTSPQNCRVALNPNWVLMAATPGEPRLGSLRRENGVALEK